MFSCALLFERGHVAPPSNMYCIWVLGNLYVPSAPLSKQQQVRINAARSLCNQPVKCKHRNLEPQCLIWSHSGLIWSPKCTTVFAWLHRLNKGLTSSQVVCLLGLPAKQSIQILRQKLTHLVRLNLVCLCGLPTLGVLKVGPLLSSLRASSIVI